MITKPVPPTAKSTTPSEQILACFTDSTMHIPTCFCMYTQCGTQRQICDTQCPCDPYAPYGQDEGRENKHTTLWVTAAWQKAQPGDLWY